MHVQHPFFLISKKQLCTRFLSTWNFQKLPSYTFYGRNVVCVPSCWLFFAARLIITFVAASISPFSHLRFKFFCFSSNEIGLVWFLSLALAFSVIHVNVDIEKKTKERIGFCCCCFISKRPGSYAPHPGLHEGVGVRTDAVTRTNDFLRTKISWIHRLPNFLPMVLRCKNLWGNNAWAKRASSAGRLASYKQALKVYIQKAFLKGFESPNIKYVFKFLCLAF